MVIVDKKVVNALWAWAKKLGSESKMLRFVTRRIKALTGKDAITQVHGFSDTHPRWLKTVERIIAEIPTFDGERNPIEAITNIRETLPSRKQARAMYTIMSIPPGDAGMPPSKTDEKPSGRLETIRRRARDIFGDGSIYPFIGGTMKQEASMNFPSFNRDFKSREKAVRTGLRRDKKYYKEKFNIAFDKIKNLAEFHLEAITRHIFAIYFAVVWRGQPAPPEKGYKAFTFNGLSDQNADRSTPLGGLWRAFRFRVPVGGPGFENLVFAIFNAGVRRYAEERAPFVYKHHGANHLSFKTNEFANGKQLWFVAVDLSQMEYSMSSDYVRVYHETFDAYMAPIGFDFSRHLFVNAPTAAPYFGKPIEGRWAHDFIASHELEYLYSDNLGMGNRSGSFIVTDVNKLAGVDCMLEILKQSLGWDAELEDVNSGSRARLFNLGDDNLFLFRNKTDAQTVCSFLKKDPIVCGFKMSVEPAPSFLKYYVMRRHGRYEFVKDASTFITNLVVSEHGTNTKRIDIERLGKSDDVDPGIGYFARLLDYASNELCIDELRPWFEKLLYEELGLRPWEAYPTSGAELHKLIKSMPDSLESRKDVDAMEYILKLNPDYIYYKLDALDIPDALLERMFLHIRPDVMRKLHPSMPYKYKTREEAVEEHPRPKFPLLDAEHRARVLKILEEDYLPKTA